VTGPAMDAWTAAVCRELGLADDPQVPLVLQVAKDVAHGVLRPAAPVTSYLLGVAVGRGADPADAAARLTRLVEQHRAQPADDPPPA
jgi:hypothetical protein